MPSFPSTLPAPKVQGTSFTADGAGLRSDMESGLARQRVRTTAPIVRMTATWGFTPAEFDTFKAWYDAPLSSGGIARGASWFTMTVTQGAADVSVTARFDISQAYKYAKTPGARWEVQAQLDIRGL